MRSIVLAAVLSLMGIAAHAQTPTLVDFATISMSAPGVPRTVTDTVCVTDGRDLTCDRQMFVLPGTKVGIGLMPSFTTANGAAILTVATDGPSSSSSLGNSAVEIESKNRNASLIISNPYSYTGQMIFRNGGLETTSGQSSVAYQNGFLRVFVSSSTPALTVTSNSQVGLGLSFLGVPQTALQVSGTIRFANGGEACDANRTGAIRYTGGDFSFCRNGTAWEPLSSLGGGASKLASLTDVVASGAVSGSVLVYNAATTSWTALPLQSVMSTTTMVAGWPDAIRCNVTSPAWGYRVLYLQEAPYLDGTVVYREPSSEPTSESRSVVFNSDGSYNSAGEYTTHTCAKTVSQLYAAGQAFNFIGGSGGSTALGDRITSGTASGVVAMAGGTISFTTGGTSGTAYLDTLGRFVGPGVSATGTVSASKVATNEVLLSKTGGLCSTVADEGRMFRNPTSGKLQVCAVRY